MGDQAGGAAGCRLILVKHGLPQIERDRPRSTWMLSGEGREAALRLAAKLARFQPDYLVCSPEPKAHATAAALGEALGLTPWPEHDVREQEADRNPFVTQEVFEDQVAQMFARPADLVLGEETGLAARSRFGAVIEQLAEHHAPVVVAHGRVITLWLSHRLGIEPMPFWKRLGLGTAAVVSVNGGTVEFVDP